MISGICKFCNKTFEKQRKRYKFCSVVCSNNFNKNGLKRIELPSYSNELAEYVGICLGDGCVRKYQISVTLNSNADKDYIPYVISLSKKLFPGANLSIVRRKDNATDVRVNSSIAAAFLNEMGIISNKKIIPSWIFLSESFKRACVKGLVDTEGSISFKVYQGKKSIRFYKQLNFRNTDMNFMRLVRDILVSCGLKPTKSLKKSLYVSNDKDISLYRELIGFGNPKLEERSKITM